MLTGAQVKWEKRSAWYDGTNIQYAFNTVPRETRLWLLKEVGELLKEVDANKTIRGEDELIRCCDAIIEEHPSFKLEEIALAFQMIKRGKLLPKLYERLKTKEILEALTLYDSEVRTPMREDDIETGKTDPHRRHSESQTIRKHLHLTEEDLIILSNIKAKNDGARNTDSDSADKPRQNSGDL